MHSFLPLRWLYLLVLLVIAALASLLIVYESAFQMMDRHLLLSQAEVLSTRFRDDLVAHRFRVVVDALGRELPNYAFDVVDQNGIALFSSIIGHSGSNCADSSLVDSKLVVRLCRIDGPINRFTTALRGRARLLVLVAALTAFLAVALLVNRLKWSLIQTIEGISKAIGDNSPSLSNLSVDGLLARLSRQRQRIEEFEASVATNARFAAIGSITAQFQHDVGGPLNIILLALKSGNTDPELTKSADEAGKRIRKMLSDLDRFSKSFRVNTQTIDLLEIIETAANEIRASEPRIPIEINCEKYIQAKADPIALIRVLTNVFKNSIEAKSPKLYCCVNELKSASKIEITISDWGSGISPELQKNLFKPFATFGKQNGTGLGLWHGSQVLSAMGGRMDLFSPGIRNDATTVRLILQTPSQI